MPAIAKILIIFAGMLTLTRLRVQLGLALTLGGMVLSLWAGSSVSATAAGLGRALISFDLWLLLVITSLIIEIARFMTGGGNSDEIVAAARRWGGRKGGAYSVMILPAVIGLVPVPAGALFSAPFVEQAGTRANAAGDWKSAVNYWFRHIWEYWWPLYPGVIIAMSIFELDTRQFIGVQFPFTLIAVAAGYLFIVRKHMSQLSAYDDAPRGSNRKALVLLSPLAVVMVSVFVTPPILVRLLPALRPQVLKMLGILTGLLAALVVIVFAEEHRGRMFSNLFRRKSLGVLLSLCGVLVFKAMLTESGLLPLASDEMATSGIPVVIAVTTLPFLAGLVTGVAFGFTGVSFPLVVGLMAQPGSGLTPLATLVLAYGFGYMGMMVSPVHLCLLVTKEYFSAPLFGVYRKIAPCVAAILVYCLAAHIVLRVLGW